MKEHWQKVLAGLFWASALGAYAHYTSSRGLTPLETLKSLAEYVRTSPQGPILFIGLYTVRPLFLFSAALLTIAAGALFGPYWAALYCVIGANLGASLAYLLGRFFGDGLIDLEAGDSNLSRYASRMRERGFETVFLMRLLFLPYDLVNYLAGLLKINYVAFLTATVLGSIPGTISFVLFGAASGLDSGSPDFDWRVLAASIGIFLASLAISKFLKKREQTFES